ncbi:hypothetical protein CABS01_07263 [Colletotrichum abscissum]|uniref:uncharacterized protein n=1 Tax=Colletotrichum abscissum TaxID=1671311 RepID=UPI0027D67368|nr:uncharacterized protein CABS01_07263 [Colletotrichum abscissum]KAK1513857.1 hypothetical protein CABS01_07263 [Colletotrichum abscissum]
MEYVVANTNTALLHLRRHRYARPPAYTGDHHASGVPSCSSPLKLPRLLAQEPWTRNRNQTEKSREEGSEFRVLAP